MTRKFAISSLTALLAALVVGSCREKPKGSSNSVEPRQERARSERTIKEHEADLTDGQSSISNEANHSDGDWSLALENAKARYSGKDLNEFLREYAEKHGPDADFDRVGFINALMEIKGPGTAFHAILTSIYSGRLDISPATLATELGKIEPTLTSFESEVFAASVSTSPVLWRATIEELSDLLTQSKDSLLYTPVFGLLQDRIYEQTKGIGPGDLADFLNKNEQLKVLDLSRVVDRTVQSNPSPWWNSFVEYCEKGGDQDDLIFGRYIPSMIEGFMQQVEPAEILQQVEDFPDASLQKQVTEGVALRWVASDAGEVARWASEAPAGMLRDLVVYELSMRLSALGLNDESRGWAQTVQDKDLAASLKSRGLLSDEN